MKKEKLTNFIGKAFLAGNTESVKLVIEDKQISTRFMSADQNVIGEVTLKEFDTKDAELNIYSLAPMIKMLSALDNEFEITYGGDGQRTNSISMKDKNDVSITYMLADPSVIQQVPKLKQLPDFDVKIALNKDFATSFKKAANALDSDNFGVTSDGSETKIIINYSTINTNRIVFTANTIEQNKMDTMCFSAKLFKEILNANSDAEGFLEVSSKGLARVTFENQEGSSIYYLVKLTIS